MLRSVIFLFVIVNSIARGQVRSASRYGTTCTTPNGETAKCTHVQSCQIMVDNMMAKRNETYDFMKKSRCGLEEPPLVCCGTYGNYFNMTTTKTKEQNLPKEDGRLLPHKSVCGKQGIFLTNKIWGGSEANLGEYPWMVRIIHLDNDYGCSGSLISERFVLTAAHCVTGEIVKRLQNVDCVRLGEHDSRTEIDCVEIKGKGRKCAPPYIDMEISIVIKHKNYDPNKTNYIHDIALLMLKEDIKFNDYIKPICLQQKKRLIAREMHIAGWGEDEFGRKSPVKKKLQMPYFDYKECTAKFKTLDVELGKNQLCAGGVEGEDACIGDSGGPLMVVESNQWYQEGIVSFGYSCGQKDWPGVYTQVAKYVQWIKKAMKKAKKIANPDDGSLIITKL